MKNINLSLAVLMVLLCVVLPIDAVESTDEQELAELKKQLMLLTKKVEQLEQKNREKSKQKNNPQQQQSEQVNNNIQPAVKDEQKQEKNDVRLYATLRPTYGYIEESGESFWDVRDALSHAGFKANQYFFDNWSAELHGEWSIDLANNADFGKARQVYVAVNSPAGRLGIGKQRPTQYLFIAEYVDIFNHSNSPFAYDSESVFFVNNLLSYSLKTGDITWMAVSQFDGSKGDSGSDLLNLGVSFDRGGFHAGATYLIEDNIVEELVQGEDEVWAVSLAYDITDDFYLATSYQDRTYKHSNAMERSGHTLDIAAAYQLSELFKIKLGYFDFDDGISSVSSGKFNGVNTTLEWLPADNLRFHLEYLHRDFDYLADFSSWTLGFRYDFSHTWQY